MDKEIVAYTHNGVLSSPLKEKKIKSVICDNMDGIVEHYGK